MANTTRSTKTSTSTKKAGAKTAPATKTTKAAVTAKGKDKKVSGTDAARTYVVQVFPAIPTIDELKKVAPSESAGRLQTVRGIVLRTMRTAERLGKLKK